MRELGEGEREGEGGEGREIGEKREGEEGIIPLNTSPLIRGPCISPLQRPLDCTGDNILDKSKKKTNKKEERYLKIYVRGGERPLINYIIQKW